MTLLYIRLNSSNYGRLNKRKFVTLTSIFSVKNGVGQLELRFHIRTKVGFDFWFDDYWYFFQIVDAKNFGKNQQNSHQKRPNFWPKFETINVYLVQIIYVTSKCWVNKMPNKVKSTKCQTSSKISKIFFISIFFTFY